MLPLPQHLRGQGCQPSHAALSANSPIAAIATHIPLPAADAQYNAPIMEINLENLRKFVGQYSNLKIVDSTGRSRILGLGREGG